MLVPHILGFSPVMLEYNSSKAKLCSPFGSSGTSLMKSSTLASLGRVLSSAIVVAQFTAALRRCTTREGAHVRRSVEAELIGLDVLHHEARLVDAIGTQ